MNALALRYYYFYNILSLFLFTNFTDFMEEDDMILESATPSAGSRAAMLILVISLF